MQVDLAGRAAIVAGVGGGIEETVARLLSENGAHVTASGEVASALAGRNGSRLDILVIVALEPEGGSAALERLCREAADAMGKGGRIVTVTSALGLVPARDESTVSAASAAILSLTRTLALELGPRGILVNAVAVAAHAGDDARAKRFLSHVPLARAATYDEIAAALLFLVDPDNSYTTGHVMSVDGGWTAGYARNF